MKDKKTSGLTNDQLRALATISPEAWEAIAALAREMAGVEDSINEKNTPECQTPIKEKDSTDLYVRVTNILKEMGIPASIKGYAYLRDAIIMVYNDWSYVGKICTALYPKVAKKYETKSSRVECAIRHAIQVAYGNSENGIIRKYILSNRELPTSSEVITSLADYLKIHA